jgi:hypothetical protein
MADGNWRYVCKIEKEYKADLEMNLEAFARKIWQSLHHLWEMNGWVLSKDWRTNAEKVDTSYSKRLMQLVCNTNG